MKIELAAGSNDEEQAAEALRSLLLEYAPAIDRYLYTDTVLIDASCEMTHSHPVLTISPPHLLGPRLTALRVLVHENMHWASQVLPGCGGILDEARQRWPEPPSPADGGARDAFSTWLHFPVCALELAAMCELAGEDEARATIGSVSWYRWIYAQLLGDELPFRDLLARHGVELPPVPPTQLPTLEALRALGNGGGHSAEALMPAIEARVQRWVLGPGTGDELAAALGDELDPWRGLDLGPAKIAAIVTMTAITHAALVRLTDAGQVAAAGAAHKRNADVYEVVATRGDEILERIAGTSDEAAAIVDWSRRG